MDGTQQEEQFIILTQTQLQINGFGQDHLLKLLENIDFANKSKKLYDKYKIKINIKN